MKIIIILQVDVIIVFVFFRECVCVWFFFTTKEKFVLIYKKNGGEKDGVHFQFYNISSFFSSLSLKGYKKLKCVLLASAKVRSLA